MGQKFGSSLAGWHWLRVPHGVVVKMLAKTTVILRLGLMLLVGLSDVAVGGTLPRDVDSTGRVLTLCQLAFPRASDPKQQLWYLLCPSLGGRTPLFPHYPIRLHKPALFIEGEDRPKAGMPGGRDAWGLTSEGVYHECVDSCYPHYPSSRACGLCLDQLSCMRHWGTLCPSSPRIRKQRTPAIVMVKTNWKFNSFPPLFCLPPTLLFPSVRFSEH